MGRLGYFAAFFAFAQRARCASAIFALVAALLFRFPGLPTLPALVCPASTALAACNRRISASISSMILFMGGFRMPETPEATSTAIPR
jgi:hypothetical protein